MLWLLTNQFGLLELAKLLPSKERGRLFHLFDSYTVTCTVGRPELLFAFSTAAVLLLPISANLWHILISTEHWLGERVSSMILWKSCRKQSKQLSISIVTVAM